MKIDIVGFLPQNKRFGRVPMANILCVDDEPSILALRKEVLEGAGYNVTTCLAVCDALYELREFNFDAVVTDWRFEDGSGRTIVKAAKSKPGLSVIVVSGHVIEAFQSADPVADIYLEKPADTVELLQVLKILLEVRTKRFLGRPDDLWSSIKRST